VADDPEPLPAAPPWLPPLPWDAALGLPPGLGVPVLRAAEPPALPADGWPGWLTAHEVTSAATASSVNNFQLRIIPF
jgi:hypothetical protein